jgi:hypothetical protein
MVVQYGDPMSLFCVLGRHKPSLSSMMHGRNGGYVALCETCGVPLVRDERGPWRAGEPLYARPPVLPASLGD